MVHTEIDDANNTGVIILRPNSSSSWKVNIMFLSAFMAVSLVIAFSFLIAGAWVILPFSLLEVAVVSACIHYCVKQCARQEVITVTDHQVRLEQGIREPSNTKTFQRTWAKFFVSRPIQPWGNLTLSIRSHGEETEIGSFLNKNDKDDLVSQLRRIVPP